MLLIQISGKQQNRANAILTTNSANSVYKTTNSANSILTKSTLQIHSLKSYYTMSILKIILYKRSSLFCIVNQHGICLPNFWNTLSIPSSRAKQFGPPLHMGLTGCPKTLVYNYQPTQCKQQPPLQHGRSLKSYTVWYKI